MCQMFSVLFLIWENGREIRVRLNIFFSIPPNCSVLIFFQEGNQGLERLERLPKPQHY